MLYPISDHFDGERFYNPEPTIRRGASNKRISIFSIIRARLKRDPALWSTWPEWVENQSYPPPGVPEAGIQASFIGHSSFLIRLPGLTLLTDPVFSRRCSPTQLLGPKRVRAPGLALHALPRPDLILLSHNHYDHMDLLSLRALRRRFGDLPIIVPLGNKAYLEDKGFKSIVELDWWQAHVQQETRITATPARHFAARSLYDRNKTLWCGFNVAHRGQTLYFAGDTGYTKYFLEIAQRLGPANLALLPIGAYEPRSFMAPVHMNPAEAVQSFRDVGARQAIGMHFGTFQLTAEAMTAPEADLAKAMDEAGLAADLFQTLDVGESRIFR